MFFCNLTDFFDRLNGTDLIICKHNRNQNGFRSDRFLQFIQIYHTVLIHIQISDSCASFFQIFAGMQNRMMFNFCCNNMISFIFICFKSSFQSPVIGFTAACCEINLFTLCSQHIGNLFSSLCNGFFASAGNLVDAGRISIIFRKIRKHGIYYFLCCFCRCCIIQINCRLHFSSLLIVTFLYLNLPFFPHNTAFFYKLTQHDRVYCFPYALIDSLPYISCHT